MIKVFETHCLLPDGTIGEVCKKLVKGGGTVVMNGYWKI